MPSSALCPFCQKGPFPLRNLYRHLRSVHECTEKDIRVIQYDFKRSHYTEEFGCETCERTYFTYDGLRQHVKNAHGSVTENAPSKEAHTEMLHVECPGCEEKFSTYKELAIHCGNQHAASGDTSFAILEESFVNWASFESWLNSKERQTYSKLVRRCTRKTCKGTIFTYTCQHARGDGESMNAQDVKQRYRQPKRIQKHCSCFAKVHMYAEDDIHVSACFGHYGHVVSSAALPLSKEDELTVEDMIKSDVPFSRIVSKLRADLWLTGQIPEGQPRLCFLTVRDVANIAARKGLIGGYSNVDDRISLKNLIENNADIAAVKLIETTDPTGDGYVLAFITRRGKSYLERFGQRGIVLDDTFNVTRYAFRLATLIVSDDAGNGFACGHLLSFRMTAAELQILFGLVQECIPNFDCRYIMTDDTYTFFNAYKSVFPESKAAKVLCSFHISQSFKRKHKELLDEKHLTVAGRLIRALLVETNPVKFERSYSAYMTWLTSIKAFEMLSFVERNYSGRRHEWAPCYRREAPFTTSNHAESWHKHLKHILLSGRQNNRLDGLIYALLTYSDDRNLQLLSAQAITRDGSRCWKISSKSHDGVVYDVKLDDTLCDCDENTNSHCERCGACAYQVQCSCPEGAQAGISCLHAHAVLTFCEEARHLFRPPQHRLCMRDGSEGVSSRKNLRSPLKDTTNGDDVSGHNAEGIVISDAPEDIVNEDELKLELQLIDGQSQLGEIAKKLLKTKQLDVMKELRKWLEDAVEKTSVKLVDLGHFARRKEMQTTGAGPKPSRIQSPFKTRSAIKSARKKEKLYLVDEQTENTTQQILQLDHVFLQTCFLCGKRDPPEDGENIVLWLSCSNTGTCKAWAHMSCTSEGQPCKICGNGTWQLEPL